MSTFLTCSRSVPQEVDEVQVFFGGAGILVPSKAKESAFVFLQFKRNGAVIRTEQLDRRFINFFQELTENDSLAIR